MNAPPIINDFKLNNINCFEENHQNNPIVGFCIEQKYNIENKFMCVNCIFEIHSCHKGIIAKEIEEIVNKNLKEQNNLIETFNQKYNEFVKILRNKIDEFKIKMNKYIEEYYDNFMKIFNENFKLKEGTLNKIIEENFPSKNKE